MHKKTKGDIAEMAVAANLLEKGWHVLFPIGENNRYDIVAERDNKFVRIQVKYVTPRNGVLSVNCRSSNNWSVIHYTKDEIDALAVYDARSKKIYYIPAAKINHSLIKLRVDKTKNNQKERVHMAKEFMALDLF